MPPPQASPLRRGGPLRSRRRSSARAWQSPASWRRPSTPAPRRSGPRCWSTPRRSGTTATARSAAREGGAARVGRCVGGWIRAAVRGKESRGKGGPVDWFFGVLKMLQEVDSRVRVGEVMEGGCHGWKERGYVLNGSTGPQQRLLLPSAPAMVLPPPSAFPPPCSPLPPPLPLPLPAP